MLKESEVRSKQLKLGMQVYCLDGKAGKVTKIITDPVDQQPTYLVVKLGRLRGRQVVVPVSMVRGITPESIELKLSRDALADFPDYEVTVRVGEYRKPMPIGYPRAIAVYTPESNRDALVLRQRNVPEGSLEVKKGMQVLDLCGDKVGVVEGILVSQEERKGKYIILRNAQTSLRQLIPAELVADVKADTIHLSIDGKYIPGLTALADEPAEWLVT
jgi:hypothetical protein